MTSRTVHFVTGARSEFDILLPIAEAVADLGGRPGWLVGASHLSPSHGMGIEEIRSGDVPVVAEVTSLLSSDSWEGRALSFTLLAEGLIRALSANRPDIVVVAGDREEALAGALAGSFLQIPVAHVFGGDRCVSSDLDEVLRPAISKIAHLHFTAAEDHRERLIRMGELPERVWSTGGPNLDVLEREPDVGDAELSEAVGIDVASAFILFIYHPSPMLETGHEHDDVMEVVRGALSLGLPVLASYPNSDPGNYAYRSALESAARESELLLLHHNFPRRTFVALYRRCAAIVGNSSSIVTESTFMGVPGVLVGGRQDLRTVAGNVIRVPATFQGVRAGLETVLHDPGYAQSRAGATSLYGDGHAAPRIADVLMSTPLDASLLRKTMPY